MQKHTHLAQGEGGELQAYQRLVALCEGVLPIWVRHLATSRAQSEVAVTQMLQAFADIGPHINLADRQAQQITEALSQTDPGVNGLSHACNRLLTPLIQDAKTPPATAAALRQVLEMVRNAVEALERIAKPFSHETQMVAEQVERMYMGFQYQDRVSQMMVLLETDLARLQEAIVSKGQNAPDLVQWLERLESQYAMAEQRKDHTGCSASAPQASDETTFF